MAVSLYISPYVEKVRVAIYIFLIHASLGIYEVECVFVDNQGCEHVFFVAPDEIPILVEVEESMCVYMAINLGI